MTTAPQSTRRLSALDGSFLRLDTPQSPMHVGWSAVFAAPDGDRPRPTIEALRERAAGRVHEVPWCRWRLDGSPFGLTEPRWIDDARFDLSAHLVQLTAPDDRVSLASFEALRSSVLSTPLDRSRPLWQIFLVPQLEDGRIGMVGKIHHALVDGIAALQIVRLVVDPEPDVESQPPVSFRPQGRGGPIGWALDAAQRAVGDGVVRRARRSRCGRAPAQRGAVAAARSAKLIATAIAEDVLPPAPQSQLNGRIGARRALVGYHAPRDLLRAARGGGGTLNDVGLTAVAGALRTLALRDGEPPTEPLKTMVPVSMRRHGEDGAGNQIAMVYMPLPVHLGTCGERLDFVREQTARLKHTDRPEATQAFVETAGGLVPPALRTPVVRALATSRQFNLTVSQSPAPRGSLFLLGCELDEVYSVVPIAQGHGLAIGMVRYRQELFFGCYADPDMLPEVHELPALLEGELQALGAAAGRSGGRPRCRCRCRRLCDRPLRAAAAGHARRPPRGTGARRSCPPGSSFLARRDRVRVVRRCASSRASTRSSSPSRRAVSRVTSASVAILDPSTTATGTLTLADIEALITDRLPLLPPLRWRLREVPLGLDYPYWVDDADFDLHFHVRELGLAAPGSDEQLAEQVARIVSRPLDRARPLWELYLISGLRVRPRRDAHEDPPCRHRRPLGRRDPRAAARPHARDAADRDDRPVGRQLAGAQRPRDARAGHRRGGALPAARAAGAAVGAAQPRGDAVQGDPGPRRRRPARQERAARVHAPGRVRAAHAARGAEDDVQRSRCRRTGALRSASSRSTTSRRSRTPTAARSTTSSSRSAPARCAAG